MTNAVDRLEIVINKKVKNVFLEKKKRFQQIYLKTKTREEELFTLSKQQHSKYTPECVVINY